MADLTLLSTLCEAGRQPPTRRPDLGVEHQVEAGQPQRAAVEQVHREAGAPAVRLQLDGEGPWRVLPTVELDPLEAARAGLLVGGADHAQSLRSLQRPQAGTQVDGP